MVRYVQRIQFGPLFQSGARVETNVLECLVACRVIGNDVVTINLGVVGGLTRHLDDPNFITVVTGGAGETWSLRFNDDALAQNFYQCVLLTQPFNVPKCQTIPLHFFQGHFRGAAVKLPHGQLVAPRAA